jgi:hypothetical protein
MPIEIRELVIRATVDPGEATDCGPPPPRSGKPGQADASPQGDAGELVQTCIREVLRILEEQRER